MSIKIRKLKFCTNSLFLALSFVSLYSCSQITVNPHKEQTNIQSQELSSFSNESTPSKRTIYVSSNGCSGESCEGSSHQPLGSLQEALKRGTQQLVDGDTTIIIEDGIYPIKNTLTINGNTVKSQGNKLTIRAKNQHKVLITGGIPLDISSFKRSNRINQAPIPANINGYWLWSGNSEGKGVLTNSDLSWSKTPNVDKRGGGNDVPRIKEWIGGKYYQILAPHKLGDTSIFKDASHLQTTSPQYFSEFVAPIGWSISRLPILALYTSDRGIYVSPERMAGALEFSKPFGPFHVNNNTQGFWIEGDHPDSQGEYTFSKGRVYLFSQQPLSKKTKLYVNSSLETLMEINNMTNVEIEGIKFSHTAWKKSSKGYIGLGGDTLLADVAKDKSSVSLEFIPPAVLVTQSNQIRVINNVFSDLGTAAVTIKNSQDIMLDGNSFSRIAGGGIRFTLSDQVQVYNSLFVALGYTFASDAVTLSYTTNFKISQNEFNDLAGRAVYVVGDFYESLKGVNHISFNKVDGATRLISDAGVFNMSVGGLSIFNNYILNTPQTQWDQGVLNHNKGIYLDIGSKDVSVFNNVIENAPLFLHGNCQLGNSIKNNVTRNVKNLSWITYASCDILGQDKNPLVIDMMTRFNANPDCFNDGSCPTDSQMINNVNGVDPDKVIEQVGVKK